MKRKKSFINDVDIINCYMNYEHSDLKNRYLIDDITRCNNDENKDAIYVLLKTKSPQMYYIVAEVTDFDIIAGNIPQADQDLIMHMIFDNQKFTSEYNKIYRAIKKQEINNEYWVKIEELSQNDFIPNLSASRALSLERDEKIKQIQTFVEPITESLSEK